MDNNNITAIVEYEYVAKEPDELDLCKGAILHRIKQMPGGWWQGTLKATGKTGMFPDNFVRVLEANGSSNGNHSDDSAATTVQLRDKSTTENRRCQVIYSYTQVNDDELTLAVGDVIEFLGEVEEGWWRGRLRTKVGVFPSNFVKHIEATPILASKRPPTIGATSATAKLINNKEATATSTAIKQTNRKAITASNQLTTDESTASALAALAAAAPAASTAAAPAAPILPPKPQRDFCRVEFPYAPQNEDELELKVDDVIAVISMELPDKGWWKGELRGKVGVFPDNFVKLLPPTEACNWPRSPPEPQPRPRCRSRRLIGSVIGGGGGGGGGLGAQRGSGSFEFLGARMASFINTIFAPLNETPQQQTQQRTAKASTTTNSTSITTSNHSSHINNHMTTTVSQQQSSSQSSSSQSSNAASTTSKVYIKKTTNSSKDSFGSRDSLNDILSETGLPSGNVAAQRKSLENKNLDLTKKQAISTSTTSSMSAGTSASSTAPGMASSTELRKSIDSLDEKAKSPPPPVLSKKPNVPLKKTPTGGVSSVAGSLLSGFKKKNTDSKLTSAVSHDLADGLAGSKQLSPSQQLPESGATGNVVMRRAATIAVEDTDFDRVERASILTDMRAGRVKAPKRRPPSAAINVLGESNNNSVYVNGSGMAGSSVNELSAAAVSSDENSTGEDHQQQQPQQEEQLAKPKPREWEKKKAPWMEELKASQVKKKTSPSVEPRSATVAERTSKLFAADTVISTASTSSNTTTVTATAASSATSGTTKVQSSAVSSSLMQQSMYVESSHKKETTNSTITTTSHSSSNSSSSSTHNNDAIMSKSMSAKAATAAGSDEETRLPRPNSLSIRNRSISPLVKTASASSTQQTQAMEASSGSTSNASPALLNNHSQEATATGTGTARVLELEKRIEKLESVVQSQQRSIDELVNALRDENERVRQLRSELDKYAQCVTQV